MTAGSTLDGVPGRLGGVGPPGRGGPSECSVRELLDLPLWVLFELVVVAAFRAGVAQACASARLVRGVVLEVALGGGPPAHRAGAGGVPDLGQVPEPDPGIVASGPEPMVARVGGYRIKSDRQARPATGPVNNKVTELGSR